jgi:hypothetical protein
MKKDKENEMEAKYYIAILCAVTLVVGAMAGGLVTAAEDAEVNDIAGNFGDKFSLDNVLERLESKGFAVTVEGDTVTAYRESPGRTMTLTIDCPDGECAQPEWPEGKPKCDLGKQKRFRFRMHGVVDIEAVKAKMAGMGLDADTINEKATWMQGMQGMKQRGMQGCPFAEPPTE